jgi:adenylate cyclase
MKVPQRFKKRLMVTAVALAVFVLTASLHYWAREQRGLLATGEAKTLDHLFQMYAQPSAASKNIVVVAIDEASLEAYGRWPWPRDRHGYLVHYLKHAGARAIVFDIMFPEPDSVDEEYDAVFAEEARAAGNVFLPYQLDTSSILPADVVQKGTVLIQKDSHGATPLLSGYSGVKPPIDALTSAAAGLGYINHLPGPDGTTRSIPLLAESHQVDRPFSHLGMAVAKYLLNPDRTVLMNEKILFGAASIPLTRSGKMLVNWHGPLERVYQMYSAGAVLRSFTDLRDGKAPFLNPSLFTDKIVFIAGTAASTYDLRVTPVSPGSPGVIVHMTAIDNILHNNFMRVAPYWSFLAITLILCLLVAAAFMLVQHYVVKFALVVAIGAAYYGAVVYAFTRHGIWVQLAFPEAAIAATFAVAASVEYLTEGRQRRQLRSVFDRFMASDVVDEIMRDPTSIKLGGEKKELTVLFSDVRGFTTISEQLPPEELVALLNEYLSAMTEIILRHRGNVNKYLGDGIMAIFGAPRTEPAHAVVACDTALASQEALVKLRTDWQRRGLQEITARIGINTGDVVVGNVGSPMRMEYTVMGDSVNLASRLEGANKFYDTQILIGPRTFALAGADFETREVDLLRVKGKRAPVVVYELLARKGQLSSVKQQTVEIYLQGLASYKKGSFSQAQAAFEKALTVDPADGPSKVYLQRSQEFLITPPAVPWDGVYELRQK